MTLLAEDAGLWDVVFPEPADRLRFIRRVLRKTGRDVLDVGCATGSLARKLREGGARPVGIDLNPTFIAAGRAKDPRGEYFIGDMRALRLRRRFDVVLCLGTTLAYCRTSDEVASTLAGFHRVLRPGGVAVIDVLNAIAFVRPTRFRHYTRHAFVVDGAPRTATIAHRLDLEGQRMSEQVTWRGRDGGRAWTRRDPEEWLRLFFPQELVYFLRVAGFASVELANGFGRPPDGFGGRRLVARATRGQ
ncbi:MAG: class I SAM-dependent methyltransferase [Polyangiaceae bacterium]